MTTFVFALLLSDANTHSNEISGVMANVPVPPDVHDRCLAGVGRPPSQKTWVKDRERSFSESAASSLIVVIADIDSTQL